MRGGSAVDKTWVSTGPGYYNDVTKQMIRRHTISLWFREREGREGRERGRDGRERWEGEREKGTEGKERKGGARSRENQKERES